MFKKTRSGYASRKYRAITVATTLSIAVGIVIILIGMIYYKYYINKLGITDTTDYNEYEYHYALISESEDTTFWDAIYQGALKEGKKHDMYVERIGSNLSIKYSLEDLMRIAIASKVDGIILEPNGSKETIELINKADKAGIPVVTVLQDEADSARKSYIGINSYSQGQAYAKEVMGIIREGKQHVTILMNQDATDKSQNDIYTSIVEASSNLSVEVDSILVDSESAFSSEEEIRRLIVDKDNSPDLLVCLTAVDTLCAYRAVVDYNQVGAIDIVGYYTSDIILGAIEKNIIHSTMTIDASQMGAYCVEALTEYRNTNNVNNYYPVDINVINKANVMDYFTPDTEEKQE